jgi:MFS family permease
VLNVLGTIYTLGDGREPGRRVGVSRAISTLGPTLALSVGAWLAVALGPQEVFLVLGAIGMIAIPIALRLPPLGDVAAESGDRRSRWRPSSLNVLFFTITMTADGVFAATLSLLLAGVIPVGSAVVAAGLLLALQRATTVVLSLVGGPIVDRIGPRRVLPAGVIGIVAGLGGVAAGYLVAAAAVIVLSRATLATVGPVLVAQDRRGNTVERMAAFATWVDCGLATGPLLAGLLFGRVGPSVLYAVLAAALALALTGHLLVSACGRPRSPGA